MAAWAALAVSCASLAVQCVLLWAVLSPSPARRGRGGTKGAGETFSGGARAVERSVHSSTRVVRLDA